MPRVFIDTNVLVYAMDQANPPKRDRCRALLQELSKDDRGVISTQVLQEFYVAATRKLGVQPQLAKSLVHACGNMETVVVTPSLSESAIDCCTLHGLSFWDALIIVSAENAKCGKIWTEDLSDGQIIRGVKIENPFKSARPTR